jgi:hypothetical protein
VCKNSDHSLTPFFLNIFSKGENNYQNWKKVATLFTQIRLRIAHINNLQFIFEYISLKKYRLYISIVTAPADLYKKLFKPRHDQNQHSGFATSMDPDQPAHPRSLIRIHTVRCQFLHL